MYDEAMNNPSPTSTERWVRGNNDAASQQFVDQWNNAKTTPAPMQGGQGGYGGQSWSKALVVGDGMRRNEQQIMQEQMDLLERMRNRGLMQER